MVDVLLFKSNKNQSEEERDERLKSFSETLNDAFKQFQKLWEAYRELLEKCKEFESNSSKVQNVAKDSNVKCWTCAAAAKGKIIPEKEAVSVAKERKIKREPVTAGINKAKEAFVPENSQTFQIFSQDFCTQGLEETFINQNKSPLQEIQNVTPKRSKSPVFGSKKGKFRIAPSPANSPGLSEKSVVILGDFNDEKSSRIDNPSISNPELDSDRTIISMSAMSPVQRASPAPGPGVTPISKNVRKWAISTTHNVNTDIIVGTNKKLKQSKLFVKTEKVTDLSACDDVCDNKASKTHDMIQTDCAQSDNNVLEDSVIQGSPERENGSFKIRQRISRKNKSAEKLQERLNSDANTMKETKRVDVPENLNNDTGQMDTDVTIFDPRIASTQYSHLPCYSKSLMIGKSPTKDKPKSLERIDVQEEGSNDSNVIDETMFVENVVPSDSRSQKKLSLGKSGKNRKLSLRKGLNTPRNPEGISRDKEACGAETDAAIDLASSEELKTASPPRKKFALANFDVLPRKKNTSPTYAYKGSPVRKQAERALLNGWSCLDCQKYYDAIGLSEEELQKRKNQCSRHRSKFNEKKMTQKDYWDPDFSSSYQSTMWSDD